MSTWQEINITDKSGATLRVWANESGQIRAGILPSEGVVELDETDRVRLRNFLAVTGG
jgi:hypothetical protein